ncbi:MAG: T9SS type A sorting domain-containing protein [Saprospiraceae bacterium]
MKNLIPAAQRAAQFLFTGLLTLFLGIVQAQTTQDPCESPATGFEGPPSPTLCSQYEGIVFHITIGAGTPFPNSASLPPLPPNPKIRVTGNFNVNTHLTWQGATIRINPGIAINVGSVFTGIGSLTLDNCDLYACTGLWKGIVMSNVTIVKTFNGTQIEDAEGAIQAIHTQHVFLDIEHTTFNRNKNGIVLENTANATNKPVFVNFSNNFFHCTAPLNGTANASFAGVQLKDADLFAYFSGVNVFRDQQYGIHSVGMSSHIGTQKLYMLRIKKDGIHMKEGFLDLMESSFIDCNEKGINIDTAKIVDVRNTNFAVTFSISPNPNLYRTGIYINKFALNSTVRINGIGFAADMEGTQNLVRGVHLKGGNVGAGTTIRIGDGSIFSFRARSSQGIYLDGIFPLTSTTEIWNNHFRVSNIAGNTLERPIGIEAYGTNINNLSIRWNTFTSFFFNPPPPPPQVSAPQFNYGICLRQNAFGTNNEVALNAFNDEIQTLQTAVCVEGFQKTKYCSNTITGSGFADGCTFSGTCTGTVFTGNIFTFAGLVALKVFDNGTNTVIGAQDNQGNEWHNYFGIEPIDHALCDINPALNRFFVHTSQSSCANENLPCFNEYHPRNIDQDMVDLFFVLDSLGTPKEGCPDDPPGFSTDELDRKIAQGLMPFLSDNPAQNWVLERYLYQKFQNNPSFTNEHVSFPPFMSSMANHSVGWFYDVHKSIQDALVSSENMHTQSQQALADIGLLIVSLTGVDEQIEAAGNESQMQALLQTKQGLIDQIRNLHSTYNNLNAAYQSQVATNLQTAYSLNGNIPTTHSYEANEKAFNQIYLLFLMQQGGELTESQVLVLQAIAQQDPKQGGPAVHAALGLLPECERPEIPQESLATTQEDYFKARSEFAERDNQSATVLADRKIIVYPSPAHSAFTVQGPWAGIGELSLFDLQGRLVLSKVFAGSTVMAELTPNARPGIYLIKILMDDGSSYVEKLSVQQK